MVEDARPQRKAPPGPKRMVYASLWDNDEFIDLSPDARLALVYLIVRCDDEGFGRLHPQTLPLVADGEAVVAELLELSIVRLHQVGPRLYYELPNFDRYQPLRKDRITPSRVREILGGGGLVVDTVAPPGQPDDRLVVDTGTPGGQPDDATPAPVPPTADPDLVVNPGDRRTDGLVEAANPLRPICPPGGNQVADTVTTRRQGKAREVKLREEGEGRRVPPSRMPVHTQTQLESLVRSYRIATGDESTLTPTAWGPHRIRSAREALKSIPLLKDWEVIFQKVADSPFLMGRVPGKDGRAPFRADLDWCLDLDHVARIREGRYDDDKPDAKGLTADEVLAKVRAGEGDR